MRVVLFKSDSEEYRRPLEALGHQVAFVEPLQYSFVNGGELRAALQEAQCDALVVTSARGAEAVLLAGGLGAAWAARPVYAVGAATARALRPLGVPARGSDCGDAGALAERVAAELGHGARVLWPHGQLAADTLATTLEARGLAVRAITAYETGASDSLGERLAALEAPDALVFFSPSGCELVLGGAGGEALARLPLFAIGRSTAAALRARGLTPAAVAAQPTPAALVDAVNAYFDAQKKTTS